MCVILNLVYQGQILVYKAKSLPFQITFKLNLKAITCSSKA